MVNVFPGDCVLVEPVLVDLLEIVDPNRLRAHEPTAHSQIRRS
jgi:hypothetical protein